MSGRVEAALAEIARREKAGETALESANSILPAACFGQEHWPWVLDVLRGDREVLEQHRVSQRSGYADTSILEGPNVVITREVCWCGGEWPCPDAARVLDRYAREVTS